MKKNPPKDVAASVRHRLQTNAKATGRPFQEVLQYFAMERFLYRLAQSPHVEKFILKGALMLSAWNAPASRPTKDIDLLARVENRVEAIVPIIHDICIFPVEADGLLFDPSSISASVIKEDADYEGVRIVFQALLQNARIRMQIDMGFGDVVIPAPTWTDYPTILDHPTPKLRVYSRETAVAEKFEAMVKLGQINSRLKDFFDIWLLSRQFDFDGRILAKAISKTFANRETPLNPDPVALSTLFAEDPAKSTQWKAFCRKSRIKKAPAELAEVCGALAEFLKPVTTALLHHEEFAWHWKAPGPWHSQQRANESNQG